VCLFTHFAAGALAGGMTGNIWAGAAAGLVSHAVLDAIPHYDHPDWRVELVGGIASLVFLLLMPFASLPAVVGGLFGMAPDLENLFQKLGKMRRSQFVFPSHTGLIPHGRNLGPRTLFWQAAIFVACFIALGLLAPQSVQAADTLQQIPIMDQPQVSVLESGQDRTVLRVEFPVVSSPADWQQVDPLHVDWALPLYLDEDTGGAPRTLPPRMNLTLAVPTTDPVIGRIRDIAWYREPAVQPAPETLIDFDQPAVFRSVPLTGTLLPLAVNDGILRSVTIELNHPAKGAPREQLRLARDYTNAGKSDRWRENTPQGITNPELFQALARGGRELALIRSADKAPLEDWFGLTSHWVKLQVTETGLYALTGQELVGMGVATGDVDPTKLRLYKGGGLQLDEDPSLPDSLQAERIGLTEVAVQVLGAQDGEWNLDDSLRFYGVASDTWLDRLDPAADRLEFYNHPGADAGLYWLTWESDTTPSPLPGTPRRVAVVAAPAQGVTEVTTARLRLHHEKQEYSEFGLVQDNWVLDNSVTSRRFETFILRTPVVGSSARYVLDYRGNYEYGCPTSYQFTAKAWLNSDEDNGVSMTFLRNVQNHVDSLRVRLVGDSVDVLPGINGVTLENLSNNPKRPLAFDSLDILYWTNLELTRGFGQLEFASWGDEVSSPETALDLKVTVPSGNAPVLWDITVPDSAVVLTGTPTAGPPLSHTYGVVRDPHTNLHLVASDTDEFLSVAGGVLSHPISLRSASVEVDYIVIYPVEFHQSAQELALFRSQTLPGIESPVAIAVLADDIYDNFAGGQKDYRAIRSYLRHVYETGGHRLRYVCLLGNATRDLRNYKNRVPLVDLVDLIPTNTRSNFPTAPNSTYSAHAYASDDGLVSLDPPSSGSLDYPDLAVGRLPAVTLEEASQLVEDAVAYASPETGLWRNRVLFTADDNVRPESYPDPLSSENRHTRESETAVNNYVPVSLDILKIYGVDYDFPPGSATKPNTRADINAALNDGTTIFYYVGHGAQDNLADEQIFRSNDIANLVNGMRRPVFLAFSCDVGVYDSLVRRSMAEQFLIRTSGGAIGAICASQVSFSSYNSALANNYFDNLYPERHISATQTLSEALLQAKAALSPSFQPNSQRYNLMGDPAVRLPHPLDDLTFAPGSVDTLRAGARQEAVLNHGSAPVILGAGDAYHLLVEESAFDREFASGTTLPLTFIKPGSSVFRGNGTMVSAELRVPFKVPVQLRYGDLARVRLILSTPEGEHCAVLQVPSVISETGPSDDVIGPRIALAFEDNRYRVRPGTPLTGALNDTSSIAILGTNPGNSILLEFDDSGFMTDVTSSFSFEADSYQDGRIVFPLPGDLSEGKHKAALHASDALGNVGSDTLSFQVVPAGLAGINSITLFPNPTPGPCRLVFELSDPMEIQWEIYSLAGSRIKSLGREFTAAGVQFLSWDGLDDQGDNIANGTYLYVLRGKWDGDGGRDITETGKLVIMR